MHDKGWRKCRSSRQTVVNIKSPHMYHAEYNHAEYSKNVTPILNNGICGVDIFKIMLLFKICDTYAAMLYLVPFRCVSCASAFYQMSPVARGNTTPLAMILLLYSRCPLHC